MSRLGKISSLLSDMDRSTRLRWGGCIALALLVAVILSEVHASIGRLELKRKRREAELAEMMSLRQRYLEVKNVSQMFANRLAATRGDDTPARLVEEIGIKGKGLRITPIKGEERGGFLEDVAEVRIDALSANDAVNMVYRLEKGTRPVLLKKALFKSRFDDPAALDVTLTIALLKQKPQGGQ